MKTKDNQSLVDIAVQSTGSVSALFRLAKTNGKSVTDTLNVGGTLNGVDVDKSDVVTYFSDKGLIPATKTGKNINTLYSGIGSMSVEENFTVE